MTDRTSRLEELLRDHARCAWDAEGQAVVARLPIVCGPRAGMTDAGPGLNVPTDVAFDPEIAPQRVDCFGVEMVMLHPFDPADFPGYQPVPGLPWLWRNGR